MASSALQKLLRKPPSFRFITSFNPSHQTLNPNPNPILALSPHPPSSTAPPSHRFDSPTLIFPSFPFGFSPTPVSESAFRIRSSPDDVEASGTLWADSVKKKRKRKMNKHKYQKLRKRMRRQS
ncbi:uncharacterized protein LOC109793744 [Cajanus cajan]|uniref:uncharacterized protein LOC109793744 n=1 Tax=Cajanus cajan TaxID=3821 RepID=UPI0010FB56E9|nr:uncharacterized protein LOC109793744 [Cajanus cajan]